MSLSARRPLEETRTSSPSSSSIAKKTKRDNDSMLEPLGADVNELQDVVLCVQCVIAEAEPSMWIENGLGTK